MYANPCLKVKHHYRRTVCVQKKFDVAGSTSAKY